MKEIVKNIFNEPKNILLAVLFVGFAAFTTVKGCLSNDTKRQVSKDSPASVIEENFDDTKKPTPEVPPVNSHPELPGAEISDGVEIDASVPDEDTGDDYYLSDATKAISLWLSEDGRYDIQTQSDFDWNIYDASVFENKDEKYHNLYRLQTYAISNEAFFKNGEQVEPEGAAVAVVAYVTDDGAGNIVIHKLYTNRELLIDDDYVTAEMDDKIINEM